MQYNASPLDRLSADIVSTGRQCVRLRELVAQLATDDAARAAHAAAAGLLHGIEDALRQHAAHEERALFPALIESMAGSDAVCLREMTTGLAAEHRELLRLCRRNREMLQQDLAGDGTARQRLAEAVEQFCDLHRRHAALETADLLPMSARLLGDAELERLQRAISSLASSTLGADPSSSGTLAGENSSVK